MIAFSMLPSFAVQLPAGAKNTSMLDVVILIRDRLDCVTEVNVSAVRVDVDAAGMRDLLSSVQGSSSSIVNNPMVQLLTSGNQNTVGQVITSLSQQLNEMSSDSVDQAVSSEHSPRTRLAQSDRSVPRRRASCECFRLRTG